jgi:uncharacterized protein
MQRSTIYAVVAIVAVASVAFGGLGYLMCTEGRHHNTSDTSTVVQQPVAATPPPQKGQVAPAAQQPKAEANPAASTTGRAQAVLNTKLPYSVTIREDSSESVELLTKKAEGGNVPAMYRLGVVLREGIRTKRDDTQAEKWLKAAADKGNADAMYELAALHLELKQNSKESFHAKQAGYWRHEAEKLGHPKAVVDAAVDLKGTDPQSAFKIVSEAALSGNVYAYSLLADYYDEGIGCEINKGEALRLRTLGADAGDEYCLVSLGDRQKDANNYSAAFKCYREAASLGNVLAIEEVITCYEQGLGVQKDEAAVKEWYEKLLVEGRRSGPNAAGLYFSARIEMLGGDKADKAKVFKYYAAAADRNNDALFELGRCYYSGLGTIPNPTKAVDCIRRAADAEVPRAMTFLGMLYREGKGVEQDHNKAVELFAKAAEKGDSNAMGLLAICYDNGEGVMKSTKTATALLEKAAALGNDSAKSLLKLRQPSTTNKP